MAEVAFDRVSKIYPDGTRAVNDVNLEITDGEFMVLVGPSGCGKTTALRMVAGPGGDLRGRADDRRPRRQPRPVARSRHRDGVPELRALPAPVGLRQHRVRPAAAEDARSRRSTSASTAPRRCSASTEYLKRKPRALSGGQRQRVAMGRAIVREPAAFLMDEPLSNLDAKLRVQTRAEIAKLQSDLGVTTIYVTHDQVEAMTMGDRVAVMRKGELQQVDDPQTLYDRPVNLFVGGFIGSPAMNMLDATIEQSNGDLRAKIGEQTISLGAETLEHRPALKAYAGKPVIIGIRPEDLEDAALVTRRAAGPRLLRAASSCGRRSARRSWRTSRSRPRTPRRTRCASSPRTRAERRRRRRSAWRRTRRSSSAGSALARASPRASEIIGGRRHAGAALLRPSNRSRHLRRAPSTKGDTT